MKRGGEIRSQGGKNESQKGEATLIKQNFKGETR